MINLDTGEDLSTIILKHYNYLVGMKGFAQCEWNYDCWIIKNFIEYND